MILAAYIPFVEPINALQSYWYLLLLPLAFGISMIYKAMRVPDLGHYWRQVGMMTTQIILAMIALGIVLTLFTQFIIPWLPAG